MSEGTSTTSTTNTQQQEFLIDTATTQDIINHLKLIKEDGDVLIKLKFTGQSLKKVPNVKELTDLGLSYDAAKDLLSFNNAQPSAQPTAPQEPQVTTLNTRFSTNGVIMSNQRNQSYFWVDTVSNDPIIQTIYEKPFMCIFAPRSSGKTTNTHKLVELIDKQYIPLNLSLDRSYSFNSSNDFWLSFGRDLKLNLKQLNIDVNFQNSLDVINYLMEPVATQKLILFIDEFDRIYPEDFATTTKNYDQCLEENNQIYKAFDEIMQTFRSLRQANCRVKSIVALGTFSIVSISTFSIRSSPFNIQEAYGLKPFTLENTKNLFDLYKNQYEINIDDEIIIDIFSKCSGHPGLINYCGRRIQEDLAIRSTNITFQDWKIYSTTQLLDFIKGYQTVYKMFLHISRTSAFFTECRSLLGNMIVIYPDQIQPPDQHSKYYDFMVSEGLLEKNDHSYRMKSPLIKNTCLYYINNFRRNKRPLSAIPLVEHTRNINIVQLISDCIQVLDVRVIVNSKSRKNNRSNGFQRDSSLPSESAYHFEFYNILKSGSTVDNGLVVYPEVSAKSSKRADILLKMYGGYSTILEFVAHQDPQGVKDHMDKCLNYKKEHNTVEGWVINFTCGDENPLTNESCQSIGLIHVHHNKEFTEVIINSYPPLYTNNNDK